MSSFSIFRLFLAALVFSIGAFGGVFETNAQDVGADVGGGAGIFRPKNPETKRRAARTPAPSVRRSTGSRTTTATTTATSAADAERIEDLLEKGNEFRDARRFAEAEDSYQSVLKIKQR